MKWTSSAVKALTVMLLGLLFWCPHCVSAEPSSASALPSAVKDNPYFTSSAAILRQVQDYFANRLISALFLIAQRRDKDVLLSDYDATDVENVRKVIRHNLARQSRTDSGASRSEISEEQEKTVPFAVDSATMGKIAISMQNPAALISSLSRLVAAICEYSHSGAIPTAFARETRIKPCNKPFRVTIGGAGYNVSAPTAGTMQLSEELLRGLVTRAIYHALVARANDSTEDETQRKSDFTSVSEYVAVLKSLPVAWIPKMTSKQLGNALIATGRMGSPDFPIISTHYLLNLPETNIRQVSLRSENVGELLVFIKENISAERWTLFNTYLTNSVKLEKRSGVADTDSDNDITKLDQEVDHALETPPAQYEAVIMSLARTANAASVELWTSLLFLFAHEGHHVWSEPGVVGPGVEKRADAFAVLMYGELVKSMALARMFAGNRVINFDLGLGGLQETFRSVGGSLAEALASANSDGDALLGRNPAVAFADVLRDAKLYESGSLHPPFPERVHAMINVACTLEADDPDEQTECRTKNSEAFTDN